MFISFRWRRLLSGIGIAIVAVLIVLVVLYRSVAAVNGSVSGESTPPRAGIGFACIDTENRV